MTRHKHYDAIVAWADGVEIQAKSTVDGSWINCYSPTFSNDAEYRIKPKTVKREGWVNIYRSHRPDMPETVCCVHPSEKNAKGFASEGCLATVRIEWEETV